MMAGPEKGNLWTGIGSDFTGNDHGLAGAHGCSGAVQAGGLQSFAYQV